MNRRNAVVWVLSAVGFTAFNAWVSLAVNNWVRPHSIDQQSFLTMCLLTARKEGGVSDSIVFPYHGFSYNSAGVSVSMTSADLRHDIWCKLDDKKNPLVVFVDMKRVYSSDGKR